MYSTRPVSGEDGIILVLPRGSSILDSEVQKLVTEMHTHGCDVSCVSRLMLYWQDGKRVKKDIFFENSGKILTEELIQVPDEPPAFCKERYNPFHAPFIIKKITIALDIVSTLNDPDALASRLLSHGFKIYVAPETQASKRASAGWRHFLKDIVHSNYSVRSLALTAYIPLTNIIRLWKERRQLKEYFEHIERIKKTKEIVVELSFGGLGDCLSYTSLPRLLKEQCGVDFYLSEKSRNVFRHPDIFTLCFGMNPYFKGFKETNDVFSFKTFASKLPWFTFFTDKGGGTLCHSLEKQFNLKGRGLPEIFYVPKNIPGYDKKILIDDNWFSGRVWALYNDPSLAREQVAAWLREGPDRTVEYLTPGGQNIFEYLDKISSAAHFLTFFSGGNAAAAALGIPATVIVPENLDGQSLSYFFYGTSPIVYRRKKSLRAYKTSAN